MQFAHPHTQEGGDKFPPTLRMTSENSRSGTCQCFYSVRVENKPWVCCIHALLLFVCVSLSRPASGTAATSALLTPLLGRPKELGTSQCLVCSMSGVDGSSPVRCVCKNTGGGGARDSGFRSRSVRYWLQALFAEF